MALFEVLRKPGSLYQFYLRFELLVSAALLVFVAVIIVYSIVLLAMTLFTELTESVRFHEAAALRDTFGLILSILILIEFNHSVALAMRRRTGVLQVRVIILISIVVIARKLILLDYAKTSLQTLLGLGGLALALGVLYWLLSHAARGRSTEAAAREDE